MELTDGEMAVHRLRTWPLESGLRVVHAAWDAGITRPRQRRPHWPQVAALLEAGRIRHLVVPTEAQLEFRPSRRPALRAWLDRHAIRVHYPGARPPPIPPAAPPAAVHPSVFVLPPCDNPDFLI
ncbi:hypothetical protein [Streptomyces aidingensis]|uniref:hypothetical protein n=1 Tax=Streptomyces aidingensis TaxID=910347 RepID=UPI001114EF20|nr:hypothetical protein [Streptomyces aidingensis]